jgi:hypothetical protein
MVTVEKFTRAKAALCRARQIAVPDWLLSYGARGFGKFSMAVF